MTDISLPILPPVEAAERAELFAALGFTAIKIKVGSDPAEDEARVRAIAHAAPNVSLRLDGNQGFTAEAAIAFIGQLSDLLPRLELFEQPTKAGDDAAMRQVQEAISLPVFADESVLSLQDAERLLDTGICRGIVLKVAKFGLRSAFTIGQRTLQRGSQCLFGCMMETHLGITAALHVALALSEPGNPLLLDLDGHLLVDDTTFVTGGLTQQQATLTIQETLPGLALRAAVVGSA